jgi:apolipoprotein N-acyltransferase
MELINLDETISPELKSMINFFPMGVLGTSILAVILGPAVHMVLQCSKPEKKNWCTMIYLMLLFIVSFIMIVLGIPSMYLWKITPQSIESFC